MLYTSNHEQDPASPRQSTDKVEPALEDDVALMDFPVDIDHEMEQLSEADMDSFLDAYRASQDELLGRVPLPSPSATALADDTKDADATDIESDTSGSDDDELEPKLGMLEAICYYLLGAFACLLRLVADALAFTAQRRYADHVATSKGYMASKG